MVSRKVLGAMIFVALVLIWVAIIEIFNLPQYNSGVPANGSPIVLNSTSLLELALLAIVLVIVVIWFIIKYFNRNLLKQMLP